uniref:Uncharacterized protein n=1 Tax=Oryza barthii TaxID=65489 RepID=A0A0D3FJW9_9ORYZ
MNPDTTGNFGSFAPARGRRRHLPMQEQASSRTPSAATPPCTLPCRPPFLPSSPAVVVLLPSLLPPCRCFSPLPER